MNSSAHNVVRTVEAERHVATGDFDGRRFRVVAAYEPTHDAYVCHVYEDEEGQLKRLSPKPARANYATTEEALHHGMLFAASKLSRAQGFQKNVESGLRPF